MVDARKRTMSASAKRYDYVTEEEIIAQTVLPSSLVPWSCAEVLRRGVTHTDTSVGADPGAGPDAGSGRRHPMVGSILISGLKIERPLESNN